MNVLSKITLQSLKKNPTRTAVTIIGIILSAAMICAVTTFLSSMQNYVLGYAVYNDGDWHGSAKNTTGETYEKICSDPEITSATYSQVLGYAAIDSKNLYKPYLYLLAGEAEDFFSTMPIHLLEGSLPQNSTELILPQHLRTNGAVSYRIGDSLTLSLGQRTLDGHVLTQQNPCYDWDPETGEDIRNREELHIRETKTYTVVGFYERPTFEGYSAPGYTALTVADSGDYPLDVYFKMKHPAKVYDFMEKNRLNGDRNTDVLLFSGVSRHDSFTVMLVSVAAVVIGLIMFGSVALIYNAFAISVSERTRQFGLLSALGATKKQLRRSVLFEALAISTIGVPLGILAGIGGIGVTLLCIGHKFSSLMGSYDAPLRLCVSWESVLIAIAVALVTVLISAWIPAKRATKITATEAIRQNTDIKTTARKIKTPKFTYRLLGLPGVLATKHYKRSKKRYRATVLSLFMSIVLFVSASALTELLAASVSGGFSANTYDLQYEISKKSLESITPEDLLAQFAADKDVTAAAYTCTYRFNGKIPAHQLSNSHNSAVNMYDESGNNYIDGYVHFVDRASYEALQQTYRLPDDTGIAIDKNIQFDGGQGKFILTDTLAGDRCTVYCDAYTLETEKTVTEHPFYIDKSRQTYLHLIFPIHMMTLLPEESLEVCRYTYRVQSDNHSASYNRLTQMLTEQGLAATSLHDEAKDGETNRNIITVIRVFAYGFTVLISLIAAANVFNTVTTNIHLRHREFAMLKSVGMTQKDFRRMMYFECLLYGSRSLLLGIPASICTSWLIYKAFSSGFDAGYRLPLGAMAVAALSVFLVVFATMIHAGKKAVQSNPIDALKNENL